MHFPLPRLIGVLRVRDDRDEHALTGYEAPKGLHFSHTKVRILPR